jgi:MFS family permease
VSETAGTRSTRLISTSFLSLFAIVGLALYGLPNYYPSFITQLGWTPADVTLGNMLGKLIIGPAFGFLVGRMIERRGPRLSMVVGLLAAGGAVAALGTIHNYSFFLVLYCFNALGYVMAGPLPSQVLLSQNFKEKRGTAMGVAYLGIGLGATFGPQITKHLLDRFGWRTALQVLGLIIVAVGMPLVLALRKGDSTTAQISAKAPRAPIGEVLKNPAFYLLAIGSFASVGAVGGAMQHLMVFMTIEKHWPRGQSLNIMSWVAAVSLFGRVGAGWLADRLGPKRIMLGVYALVASGALMLMLGPTTSSIYAFAVVFGLGLGGEYMIIPLMAGRLFGTAVLGRVMGLILTFDGVAEASIPYLVGKTYGWTHSYTTGFKILTGLAILGAAAIALLPSSERRHGVALAASPERSSAAS